MAGVKRAADDLANTVAELEAEVQQKEVRYATLNHSHSVKQAIQRASLLLFNHHIMYFWKYKYIPVRRYLRDAPVVLLHTYIRRR